MNFAGAKQLAKRDGPECDRCNRPSCACCGACESGCSAWCTAKSRIGEPIEIFDHSKGASSSILDITDAMGRWAAALRKNGYDEDERVISRTTTGVITDGRYSPDRVVAFTLADRKVYGVRSGSMYEMYTWGTIYETQIDAINAIVKNVEDGR
jgi:hypothetical protein